MKVVGGVITAIGVVLWCGNVFGFFPTFPMLGYITIVVGGAIASKGSGG